MGEFLWKVFQKFWQILVGALVVIFVFGMWVYDRLWQLYRPNDFLFFGLIGVALIVLGWLLRFIIRNVQFLDDFFLAVWDRMKRFRSNSAETAVEEKPDVIIKNDAWLRIVAENYKPGRRKPALPLGFTTKGKLVEIAMTGNESHLMLTGGTGLGKGVLMNQFLVAAAMSGLYQVVIVSRSGKDYTAVAGMNNIHMATFGDDPDPIKAMREYVDQFPFIMRSAHTEVARRQNLCEKHGVSKISDLRVEYRPAHILMVVEEFSDTADQIRLMNGSKALADMFTLVSSITKIGRASNFHLCLINQSPVGEIPRNVRKQMRKATFALENSTDSFWATDIKGAGAEYLYRYSDNAPEIPSELLYIGGNAHHTLRPAFTNSRTLSMASRFVEKVKDAGKPTWLYGWKDKKDNGVMQHNKIVAPQPTIITQETRQAVMNGSGAAVVETAVAAPPPQPKILTAKQAFKAAGYLFDNHADFAKYREKDAFSKLQAQGIFVLLHSRSGMSKTAISKLVFGHKNGRYFDFINHCQRYLVAVEKKVRQ